MKFAVQRETLLSVLQSIVGAVERKQSLPILSNVLINARTHQLSLTTTDLGIEYVGTVVLATPAELGATTVAARKLIDICRLSPEQDMLQFSIEENKLVISSGKNRCYRLATLPAEEFPKLEETAPLVELTLEQRALKQIISDTAFSMAQHDVRYFLNGMFLSFKPGHLTAVAADGHRLALSEITTDADATHSIIVPRKAIIELNRLLSNADNPLNLTISANYLRVVVDDISLLTKLIDGRYPDHKKVVPTDNHHQFEVERDELQGALTRIAVLSNEKNKGIKLHITNDQLTITTSNPEQENAEETLAINYQGKEINVGFNADYLLDILNVFPNGPVGLAFSDANSSVLLSTHDTDAIYVVMPLRL